jgi:hypothetical protein
MKTIRLLTVMLMCFSAASLGNASYFKAKEDLFLPNDKAVTAEDCCVPPI